MNFSSRFFAGFLGTITLRNFDVFGEEGRGRGGEEAERKEGLGGEEGSRGVSGQKSGESEVGESEEGESGTHTNRTHSVFGTPSGPGGSPVKNLTQYVPVIFVGSKFANSS